MHEPFLLTSQEGDHLLLWEEGGARSLCATLLPVGSSQSSRQFERLGSSRIQSRLNPAVKPQNLIAAAHNQNPRKAARDVAILRLAYGLGLRRGEIVSLNIGHADLEAGAVHVMGKGSSELEPLTLPANAKAALEAWLAVRGTDDPAAPLFVNVSRAHHGERMPGAGVYHLIRCYLGTKAGVIARPHGLRHTAITKALDVFSGDYRKARAFSRHASLDTVRRYDDNRADHGGQVAHAIDALVSD